MQFGFFNEDERIVINAICKDENLDKLTKKDAEEYLLFACQIVNEEDEMTMEVTANTYEKVKNMSVDDWNQLKMLTPLPVSVSQDDLDSNMEI